MTPLLLPLSALVALAWCVPTTSAIACHPGRRYMHPFNCSKYILCDKHHNPKIFECPERLQFNAVKTYCDWPEAAKCTLDKKKEKDLKHFGINGTAFWKTKGNKKHANVTITIEDAAIPAGELKNKTNKDKPVELIKFQLKDPKKEVKRFYINMKTTNESAKSAVPDINKGNSSSDNSTSIKPSDSKQKFELKSGKSQTEEKISGHKKTIDSDSGVKKSGFSGKASHSISKRQSNATHGQAESKKKDEMTIKEKSSTANKKLSNKPLEEEVKRSNMTGSKNDSVDKKEVKVKNVTFSNKRVNNVSMEMNETESDPNNKDVPPEPTTTDAVYAMVGFDTDLFGYDADFPAPGNSTNELLSKNTSQPTSKFASKSESVPASKYAAESKLATEIKSAPTSGSAPNDKSTPAKESAPASKYSSKSESAHGSKNTPKSKGSPRVKATAMSEKAPKIKSGENAAASKTPPTSESAPTSKSAPTSESAPTSKSAPTSENAPKNESVSPSKSESAPTIKSVPTSEGSSTLKPETTSS